MPVMEIILPPQSSGNVPAFLAKLWKMVDNPETDLLIAWTDEGTSFIIKHQAEFARELLPYYYKHSNMASFIRQLNMYGFHKVMSVDSGGLKGEKEEIEFAHPYFLRGQEHLLDQIKRKVSVGVRPPHFMPNIKSDKVTEVLSEVNQLKDRQEDTDTKLETMKMENEALWQEVLNLRQKHSNQQKIVNKLIQFLVALVQPRMSGVKRRYQGVPVLQLAIEDCPANIGPKEEMTMGAGPVIQDVTNQETQDYELNALFGEAGPVVSEASPAAVEPEILASTSSPPPPPSQKNNDIVMEGKYRLVDPTSVNPSLFQVKRTAGQPAESSLKRPALMREISKEDFDMDISNMQQELDNLKEILSGQITLDTSLVSSLFSPEEQLPASLNLSNMPAAYSFAADGIFPDDANGDQQQIAYNPSLFQLTEEETNSTGLEEAGMLNCKRPRPPDDLDLVLNTPLVGDDDLLTDPLSRIVNE